MRGNTITLRLIKGGIGQANGLFQYDYGQKLILSGVELPANYEVHFSNCEYGNSKTMLGNSTGVDIPDEYLLSGEDVHVWLFLHDGSEDGETEYHGVINVTRRAKPTDDPPTPQEQSIIEQTIAALNEAVENTQEIADGIPGQIDDALQEAKDSGEFDGFSPIANVVKEGRTATITITDQNGTTSATVSDPDPTELIDDTAGQGDTQLTWSADKIIREIGDVSSFDIEIVDALPTHDIKLHTIYFLRKTGELRDHYDEYMYINSEWELIGTTQVDVSDKADKADTILLTTLSRGRKNGTTVGAASFAFGTDVTASGQDSHAEGQSTTASGMRAHAEGESSRAVGNYSHAEGYGTTATGVYAHAEGNTTSATSSAAHAEGSFTRAFGQNSHAEGYGDVSAGALGRADHAEGYKATANSGQNGYAAHAEGRNTIASNNAAHAEGDSTLASGSTSHAEGLATTAQGVASHAEGYGGSGYGALGKADHAEGFQTIANSGTSDGYYAAHAEGYRTEADLMASHAEGSFTQAAGSYSHAEGYGSIAYNTGGHAEGDYTKASGSYAHSEGDYTRAGGNASHAEGYHTETYNAGAHSEGGFTKASGQYSHAQGFRTTAKGYAQFVFGKNNIPEASEIITIPAIEDVPNFNSGVVFYLEGSIVKVDGTIYVAHNNALVRRSPPNLDTYNWQPYTGTPTGNEQEWSRNTLYTSGTVVKLTVAAGTYEYYQYISQNMQYTYIRPGALPDGLMNWHSVTPGTNYTLSAKYIEIVGNGAQMSEGYNIRTLDIKGNETLNGGITFQGFASMNRLNNSTVGENSVAVGATVEASGYASHAEGAGTHATNSEAHAEGAGTTASGTGAHSEGSSTTASGNYSHAEGGGSRATGGNAHAEGAGTTASGNQSHAEGGGCVASGHQAHAEGAGTTASGVNAHAEGGGTIANHASQHVFGTSNVEDPSEAATDAKGTYVEIVGNGAGANDRGNARTLDWNGNERLKGDLYVGCSYDSSGGHKVISAADVATTTETQAIITEYGVSA